MSARPRVVTVGAERMKVCRCGALFPLEFDRRGQPTGRQLCERCREKRQQALPDTTGVPRCVDCTALVGREWGTVTHLDAEGRCPSCAAWHARMKTVQRPPPQRPADR